MSEYRVRDGTRITLDSTMLNFILNKCNHAKEIKANLFAEICRQSIEEEPTEPCRFKDNCIGACDWCKSHDYSEACVPMLQAEVKRQTKSATEAAVFILKTILKNNKENE